MASAPPHMLKPMPPHWVDDPVIANVALALASADVDLTDVDGENLIDIILADIDPDWALRRRLLRSCHSRVGAADCWRTGSAGGG